MSKVKSSPEEQRQFWQMALEAWQASGLSVRRFCQQEGLAAPSFYAWRKRLTQVPTDGCEEPVSAGFIEVTMTRTGPVALELALVSGNTLKIPADTDSQTLREVIAILQQAELC